MEPVIWSQGLTRRFDSTHAVQDLNLQVRGQAITAFLGPNGAGKTTTIRLLLGLLKADSGACTVLGHPPGHMQALAQLGALVESPALYDHLTGHENLEVTRLMRGLPKTEAERVLKVVELSAAEARRPVLAYSLGMRQRLGLAQALMGRPRLLILDEPTNGLDPVGIQDMRNLIRSLPRETGASIFLSSHLLAEVEQVAEDLVVIHKGRLRYQGRTEGLGAAEESELVLRVGDSAQAMHALTAEGYMCREAEGKVQVQAPPEAAPRIVACLVLASCALYEVAPRRTNLEARFLALLEDA